MIQETVNNMPGITSGIIDSAKNSFLTGVLVRSFIHARVVPRQSANTATPAENCTEWKKRRKVSALQTAVRKIPSVKTAAREAVCGGRKLCQTRNTCGTSASHITR